MRVFVRLKELIVTHKDLEIRLKDLERKIETQEVDIQRIFEAIRELITVKEKPRRRIGFHTDKS